MIKCEFEDGNKASLRHVCADVILFKDDKVMLTLRAEKLVGGGKWALLGGYVDRDETVIQAAEREVMEESGWGVKDLKLLKVIDDPAPRGDDRQNVVFVYVGTATEKTGEPDWETQELRWYGWDELPQPEDMAFDHLDLIHYYRERVALAHASEVE